MAQGKAGLAGGAVLALGLGAARFGDDCARAGVRGARAVDDVAVGSGYGWAHVNPGGRPSKFGVTQRV